MSKFAAKIKAEFEELLPPTIFFFVVLHLVAILRVLMLEGTGIALGTSVSITVAALILAMVRAFTGKRAERDSTAV